MANNYSISALASVLDLNYKAGNRRPITQKMATENGVNAVIFKIYEDTLTKLYGVVKEFCRIKNSPKSSDTERKAARELIYPLWRELLTTAEANLSSKLHVNEDDIIDLCSFVQTFADSAVNVDFEEKWACPKVWTSETFRAFQKKVETMLGIRMNERAVLSDIERDYLRALRGATSNLKNAQAVVDDLDGQITLLKVEIEGISEPAVKAYLTRKLDDLKAKLEEAKPKAAAAAEAQNLIRNMTPEQYDAYAREQAAAKTEARRAEKKAKKEAKKEAAKAEAAPEAAPVEKPKKARKSKKAEAAPAA